MNQEARPAEPQASLSRLAESVRRPHNLEACLDALRAIFEAQAIDADRWRQRNLGYHRMLADQYRFLVPPGQRVLEVGCGDGDLLAALEPCFGVGVDLSPAMVERARHRHGSERLRFHAAAIEEIDLGEVVFDVIVMSDLVGYLYDIKAVLAGLLRHCHPRTRLVLNFHSRLWEPVFGLAEKLSLKAPRPVINWVTREDVDGLLRLAGFETVRSFARIVVPKRVPIVAPLVNRFLAPLWPFSHLCVANFVVARPLLAPFPADYRPRVSVVVPCRNEAGNIPAIVARVPDMGASTEIVFVEGGSSDDTFERCLEAQRDNPGRAIQVHRQPGTGKGDAVRFGFSQATGDVLMILDADMTVPPEDLDQFYDALVSGRVEMVNGSRLVYAMGAKAMRFLNLLGNKLFAWAFSFLLEQRVKDTLCGTKVLLREDYQRIAAGRSVFGDFDPFGDFDLLFGAARRCLKIQDLPVRYRDRTYGDTNISRFRHGLLLLRMCWVALLRLKCR